MIGKHTVILVILKLISAGCLELVSEVASVFSALLSLFLELSMLAAFAASYNEPAATTCVHFTEQRDGGSWWQC